MDNNPIVSTVFKLTQQFWNSEEKIKQQILQRQHTIQKTERNRKYRMK